jgi:hypothetical protein
LERAYDRRGIEFHAIVTNYDFSKKVSAVSQPVYKIHGTISHDVVDGSKSRMILTSSDYDKALQYREFLFTRLASDMAGADLVIIGYSLSDPDIKAIIDNVLQIQSKMDGAGGQVYLLLYQRDDNRAKLFENRNVRVCFGGIDQFSEALTRHGPAVQSVTSTSLDPVQQSATLSATAIDVKHSLSAFRPEPSAMFNGWPARYSDVAAELTFPRTLTNTIIGQFKNETAQHVSIIGAGGVGKTTCARQICVQLDAAGWICWEHKVDFDLPVDAWIEAAEKLEAAGQNGLLFIDEAHFHLPQINRLIERCGVMGLSRLRVLLAAPRGQWQHRTKAVALSKRGNEHSLSKLNSQEIDRLIMLVSGSNAIRPLVEGTFAGFSFQEKRTRLSSRCEADAFVCLRNIFATESFDDIILREYAQLKVDDQEIYRLVAAMEHAGIRVHRQLVVRLTNIAAGKIGAVLDNLVDVISEYDVSTRFGVYGWKVRHSVIAGIIAKYKFSDPTANLELFENVINNISPTYEIERRTINEMCNVDTGLPSIPDKDIQNRLLRKLISVAPGEPVPRHRLIRNLITLDKFDLAETEIRVFRSELGSDGPVARYQIACQLARAVNTPGIMDEDRLVILKKAESQAALSAERYSNNRGVLSMYCEVALEILKRTGDDTAFESAMKAMRAAEQRTEDEEIAKAVRGFERRRYEMALS